MQARIVKLRTSPNGTQSIEALSDNELLFVFAAPAGAFRIGESIRIDPGLLGKPQAISSASGAGSHSIVIHPQDVHDLRIPTSHGASRTPSKKRLAGA